jgi:hypothetical protein
VVVSCKINRQTASQTNTMLIRLRICLSEYWHQGPTWLYLLCCGHSPS